MKEALDQLEKFLHVDTQLPPLVELALIHYQFETIHPFLDGNGRIGRLLVALFLCQRGILNKPLLYLSAFFERHRQDYYDRLLEVSQRGAWRQWLEFFLQAVVNQSDDAVWRARRLLDLHRTYCQTSLGRRLPPTATELVELIFVRPVINAKVVREYLKVTFPAAQKAIKALIEEGFLTEITGGKRNKAYAAKQILEILEEESSPPTERGSGSRAK
jgi:Fic family protein